MVSRRFDADRLPEIIARTDENSEFKLEILRRLRAERDLAVGTWILTVWASQGGAADPDGGRPAVIGDRHRVIVLPKIAGR